MAFNLLDLVKDQVSGQLAKHASEILGESESGTATALGGVFPTVLSSLISKGTDESTASGMFDLVKSVDPGILGNIGSLSGGANDDKPDSLLNMGNGLLSSLIGDKLGSAVDLISKMGGIKSGSAVSLFKMATPFLMALINKKVSSEGMDLSDFMSLLTDQKESVSKMLPKGMGSLMGLDNDAVIGTADSITSTGTGSVSSVTTTTAIVANNSGAALFKWLIPALIILGAIYFLTQSKMCKGTVLGDSIGNTMGKGAEMTADVMDTTAVLASDAVETMVEGVKTAGNQVVSAFSNVDEGAKATLSEVTFTAGSAGSQMMEFIKDGASTEPTFGFKNLNFESDSAVITDDSNTEIENLAAILLAYPDVKIRIDGYIDAVGDEIANQKLSEARANAVKVKLVEAGINENRILAEGHAGSAPTVDNTSLEEQAKNSRIVVTIVQ